MIYSFENFEVDTDRFEIRCDGVPEKVEPQVFSLIELLVSNHRQVVSKDEINLRIWGGRIVSEAVVNSRIRTARQVLGDNGKDQRIIETIRGRGFRFALAPEVSAAVELTVPAARPMPAHLDAKTDVTNEAPAIAVLPFQMMSDDARYAMLADAVAHETIVELSRLHWLFVIARGSSFRFREPDADLTTVGEVLGARYLLTGSVTVLGNRSVVSVELASARDNRVLWGDRFETPLQDLLELRFTIVTQIVSALELRIPLLEAGRAATVPTDNLDSWSAYHRGLWHMHRFNPHDNEIAARMFQRAVEADQNFARAYAGLSFTHFQNAFVGYSNALQLDRDQARAFAEKSIELDPLDPFANLTLGRAYQLADDLASARVWFDRSVELNPNYAMAMYNRGLIDAIAGLGAESEASVERAMALSPIDPLHYAFLGARAISYLVREDYQTAQVWAEKGARAPNAHVILRVIAAMASRLAGDLETTDYWVKEIQRVDGGYDTGKFLNAFPFRDDETRAKVVATLNALAINA